MSNKSELEEALDWHIRVCGLPAPEREYQAIPGRKHRFDFAWPSFKLLLDVQGGIFNGGKHGRGTGILKDQEKLKLSTIEGWHVMHISNRHITQGQAIHWLRQFFEKRPANA